MPFSDLPLGSDAPSLWYSGNLSSRIGYRRVAKLTLGILACIAVLRWMQFDFLVNVPFGKLVPWGRDPASNVNKPIATASSTNSTKEAYLFLYPRSDLHEMYFKATLLFIFNLLTNPGLADPLKRDVIIMTSNLTSSEDIHTLQDLGAKIFEIPFLLNDHYGPPRDNSPIGWQSSWNKFWAWTMTDYDRVLYLDCDMIMARPIHTIWDDPHSWPKSTLAGCRDPGVPADDQQFPVPQEDKPYMNAGMMLIRPDTNVFKTLLSAEVEKAWHYFDQDLLNRIFDREGLLPWEPLNHIYMSLHPHTMDLDGGVHLLHEKAWKDGVVDLPLRRTWYEQYGKMEGWNMARTSGAILVKPDSPNSPEFHPTEPKSSWIASVVKVFIGFLIPPQLRLSNEMTRGITPPQAPEPEIGGAAPHVDQEVVSPEPVHHPYAGFVAGVCSGWTKLIVGHPFDTIKTRLQCAPPGTFGGAWHCFTKTVSKEGPLALYKGASVPAISWGITDSILMGRAYLKANGFAERDPTGSASDGKRLSLLGHTIAGLFAGWTNACIAHPTEMIKCKLQLQLVQPADVPKQFAGPVDVVRKTVKAQGATGMFKGLGASFIYRSSFLAMFGGFEIFNRLFQTWDGTSWAMSKELSNFLAGGLASNLYWGMALPFDNVKNRIMTDSILTPRYKGVFDAYKQVWRETYNPNKGLGWNSAARIKNFYRGAVPVVLRAFPTNAAALAVWEGIMRYSTKI